MERHGAQSRWLCCPGPGISADGPKAREGGEENEPLCGAAALRWGRAGPSLSSPLLSSPPRPGGRYIGGVWFVAVRRPRHRIHAA